MANLFQSMWDGAADSIKSPLNVVKDLGKGDFSGALKNLKHMPGNQSRANSKILEGAGIRGWVGKHPGETAGAVAATIIAAPFVAAGTAGAGAGSAGAGAGAGVAGTGAGAAGGVGASAYMAPAAAGGVSSSAMAAQAPSTAALLGMGNAGVGASSSTAGSSVFTPAMLTTQGAAASGGTYGAASAPMSTSALGSVPASTSSAGSGMSYAQIGKLLQSIKPGEQQSQLQPAQMAPAPRGSFNFDRKAYQNQALTQSYSDMYTSPTRAANIGF